MIFYPLNNIQYSAEDAQLFNCTRNSGVYAKDDFRCEVTGLDNNVTVNLGVGWMRLDRFKGGVFALRDVAEIIDLGIADDTLPRIDVVGVQFSANDNDIKVFSKQGTPASQPKIPPIVQNENVYELYFCSVKRPTGATEITPDMVTDLRMDSNYCGLMADSITKVDTKAINEQIQALIDELEKEIKGVRDGSAFVLKAGDTLKGELNMAGHKLTGLAKPTSDKDAVPYSTLKEFCVEEIVTTSKGKWTIHKWSNGTLEVWYRQTTPTVTNFTRPWGALFETNVPVLFEKYPNEVAFLEKPMEFPSVIGDDGMGTMFEKTGGGSKTSTTTYYLVRPVPIDESKTIYMGLYAIGRWDTSTYQPVIDGNEVAY